MRKDFIQRKKEILEWIEEKKSKRWICAQLHCANKTLNEALNEWGIIYGGQPMLVNTLNQNYIPLEEYLKSGTDKKGYVILQKLLKENYKEEKCEICGLNSWQGYKLPLEIHHIDGNHSNNTIENFQILCPNCHSIQEGHRGRKKILEKI